MNLETAKLAVKYCVKNIENESKISFREFEIEDHTNGRYGAGMWTYRVSGRNVGFEYWFSPYSSRKQEFQLTFDRDHDLVNLESQMRKAFNSVRTTVSRKRGTF